jgi:hypothetical protein
MRTKKLLLPVVSPEDGKRPDRISPSLEDFRWQAPCVDCGDYHPVVRMFQDPNSQGRLCSDCVDKRLDRREVTR